MTRKNAKLAAVTAKSESIEDMDGEREGCSADGAGEGSGAGGGAFAPQYGVELSKEERHGVVLDEVRRYMKPDGEFGENAARLLQKNAQAWKLAQRHRANASGRDATPLRRELAY